MSKKPNDFIKPTQFIQVAGLITISGIFAISAFTKSPVPLPVYAIIAGVIFGIGNIGKIFGGK